jgi:tetratricopeptide (TPR) repeat protein
MDSEQRLAELWESLDVLDEQEFLARLDRLAGELPAAEAAYERGGGYDSTGHPERAVPLYREALELGLEGSRRRQCVIQLASSLRNLGEVEESVALLEAERSHGSDELDDAVSAFLALALVSAGREREAVSVVLSALAEHLPRYQRSVRNYAQDINGE